MALITSFKYNSSSVSQKLKDLNKRYLEEKSLIIKSCSHPCLTRDRLHSFYTYTCDDCCGTVTCPMNWSIEEVRRKLSNATSI